MSIELRSRNQSQNQWVAAYSSNWHDGIPVFDPSLWLLRDPDAEEKMLRDADIAHAVGFRRHLIAGQRWSCRPCDEESEEAVRAAEVAETLLRNIKHFSSARVALARAFFSGARFARIIGEPRILSLGDGKPRVWWVPTMLQDQDKRMYRPVADSDGVTVTAHWERWDVAKMQWVTQTIEESIHTIRHVYQDDQSTLGHGRALREALGWWWYNKTHVLHESVQAAEKHGQGILKAKINGLRSGTSEEDNEKRIQTWLRRLEEMRGRHVIVHDDQDDIEVVSQSGTGWNLLKELRDEARTSVATLVLGANMNTQASEGGSYALAEVHENATEALIQFDRSTLEETLTDDLIGCLWFRNHANLVELGLDRLSPQFDLTQEKRQDPVERATTAVSLSGIGVALSLDDVLDQTGFRRPKDDEEQIKPRAPEPAFGGFAPPPGI